MTGLFRVKHQHLADDILKCPSGLMPPLPPNYMYCGILEHLWFQYELYKINLVYHNYIQAVCKASYGVGSLEACECSI